MQKVSAQAFADFLTERVRAKDGYIMGATGQNPQKLSQWYFNQYSGELYTKALYWKTHAERVWDCNGLAEGYYRDQTGQDINTRARYNYSSWCATKGTGLIPAQRRVPGAAVFWGDSAAAITHVAFLTRPVDPANPRGDWILTEARGVKYGVVETRLTSRRPNFWGWMEKYFSYDEAASDETRLTVTGSSVHLRRGPGTQYESVRVLKKGTCLQPVDPTGWSPVREDGAVLWISSQYVQQSNEGE